MPRNLSHEFFYAAGERAAMDPGQTPRQLPATVTRRPWTLVGDVMTQSLREQGTASRAAAAWRWIFTGQGTSPIKQSAGPGRPPTAEEIIAEAAHRSTREECAWPPWLCDPDADRRQARRVLRWLTCAADAIPLSDPNRGGTSAPGCTSPGPTRRSAASAAGQPTASNSTATSPNTCPAGTPNTLGGGPPGG